jgi:hypothetical protein
VTGSVHAGPPRIDDEGEGRRTLDAHARSRGEGPNRGRTFDVDGTVMKVTTLSPLAAASGLGATSRSGMFGKRTARPVTSASASHIRAPDMAIDPRRSREVSPIARRPRRRFWPRRDPIPS